MDEETPHLSGTRRFITVLKEVLYMKLTWQLNPVHFIASYFSEIYLNINPLVCVCEFRMAAPCMFRYLNSVIHIFH
jgi:hypothetical protein